MLWKGNDPNIERGGLMSGSVCVLTYLRRGFIGQIGQI